VSGYDYLANFYLSLPDGQSRREIAKVSDNGETYLLYWNATEQGGSLSLTTEGGETLLTANVREMLETISAYDLSQGKQQLPAEKMTFDAQGERAKIRVIFQNASVEGTGSLRYGAGAYVLFSIVS
jgi:hypothetical protein